MQVQNVTGATGTADAAPSEASRQNLLDYDAFLNLLVAQMQNQSPTDPVDATKQLSQLANFSQLAQTIKMNERLDAMLTSSVLSQADGIIGRTITSADGSVSGEVVAMTIDTGNGVAVLGDGQRVPIETGVKIS